MSLMETMKPPTGVIQIYEYEGEPKQVWFNESEKQGYIILPKPEKIFREQNLIVRNASVFIANRMRPGNWGNGITYLEVGTGVGSGTPQAPEVESIEQKNLRSPLVRKQISSWTFLTAAGQPTQTPTNIIELTTTFDEEEAIGALVEMGLYGGDAASSLGSGQLFNYKVFPVWNKSSGMKLTVIWKLTF